MKVISKHYSELTVDELYGILKARAAVFVVEQNCPYQDLDDRDKDAYHIYLEENGEILAYLRVLKAGVVFDCAAIGRVLTTVRGMGYSTIILNEAIKLAKEVLLSEKIKIEAQTYAKGMYEKLGFVQTSEEFLEDGIPHIEMTLC